MAGPNQMSSGSVSRHGVKNRPYDATKIWHLAQNPFALGPKVEGWLGQDHAAWGLLLQSNLVSGRLVAVGNEAVVIRHMFSQDNVSKLGQLWDNGLDLAVIEVLQYLLDKGDVARRKAVASDVDDLEVHVAVCKCLTVVLDQFRDDIACGVVAEQMTDLATHVEVATSEVHSVELSAEFAGERFDRLDIGRDDACLVRARARVKGLIPGTALQPVLVDVRELVAGRSPMLLR